MKKILRSLILVLLTVDLAAQSFEVAGLQNSYKGYIGDIIKAPLSFKNTSSKPLTLIIRKDSGFIGTSQKNYFCLGDNCLDQRVEDHSIRIEPGQTVTTLQIALESGLAPAESSVRYRIFNRSNPAEEVEIELNFIVEEKPLKQSLYSSPHLTIQDVYPNPSSLFADVDYQMHGEPVEAHIILHNVLGTTLRKYELAAFENKVKIITEDLKEGVYFYTLYIDQQAVMTQKLVVNR